MDLPSVLVVPISEANVKQGKRGRSSLCPVALAIKDCLPKNCEAFVLPRCNFVGEWYALVQHISNDCVISSACYHLSPEVGRAIKAFDQSNKWDFSLKEITITRNK